MTPIKLKLPHSVPLPFWARHHSFAHHGLVIFLVQIGLLALVPILDDGNPLMPLPYTAAVLAGSSFTIFCLGYRRLAVTFAVAGAIGLAFVASMPHHDQAIRFPTMIVLLLGYGLSVYLAIYQAFAGDLTSAQRILCGAASFVMIGFVFAVAHGLVHYIRPDAYTLATQTELLRTRRWLDFLWLSFSTLTTAGFNDVIPVTPWPCTLATLEGLCGILFPATLIARIASLPPGKKSDSSHGS